MLAMIMIPFASQGFVNYIGCIPCTPIAVVPTIISQQTSFNIDRAQAVLCRAGRIR